MNGATRYAVGILVVDDSDLFRIGLRMLLEDEGFKVAVATNGDAAVRQVRSNAPDVILMDLHMPGIDGIEATRRIRAVAPDATVIMLTNRSEEAAVLDAVRAGANGYLLKDSGFPEIVAGVKAAAAGESTIAPRVAGGLIAHVRASGQRFIPAGELKLSAREREVLALLVDGHENAEIARELHLSISTVKAHVSALFAKLGVENRVQAAVQAIQRGLVPEHRR